MFDVSMVLMKLEVGECVGAQAAPPHARADDSTVGAGFENITYWMDKKVRSSLLVGGAAPTWRLS